MVKKWTIPAHIFLLIQNTGWRTATFYSLPFCCCSAQHPDCRVLGFSLLKGEWLRNNSSRTISEHWEDPGHSPCSCGTWTAADINTHRPLVLLLWKDLFPVHVGIKLQPKVHPFRTLCNRTKVTVRVPKGSRLIAAWMHAISSRHWAPRSGCRGVPVAAAFSACSAWLDQKPWRKLVQIPPASEDQ